MRPTIPLFALGCLACAGLFGEDSGGAVDPCTWYRDQDGDGYGDPERKESTCEVLSGHVNRADDCDDQDPGVNPDGVEVCDGGLADEDCDGLVDEEDDSLELTAWYADADGDGYGDPDAVERACEAPAEFVENAEDCDDSDRSANPDGQEVCDGAGGDEDCDGLVDMDDDSMASSPTPTWYPDADGDGHSGSSGAGITQCEPIEGYATARDDCDDTDPAVNPDVAEVCGNGLDDNCNNSADGCALTGDVPLDRADVRLTGSGLGYAVCGGGDLNDDGLDDVVSYGSVTGDGGAYAFFGGTDGDRSSGNADVTFTAESKGERFGHFCAIGDLNADGNADVAIGDGYYSDSSSITYNGRVYLFASPLSGNEAAGSANTIFTNAGNTGEFLGRHLAIGDWTGDRKQDLFISSGDDKIYADFGGIPASTSRDIHSLNDFEGSLDYSSQIATGGDVDGDGADDLVAGYASSSIHGAVYLFTGGFGGEVALSSRVEATLSASSGLLGTAQSIRGDLNGDGYADLLEGDYSGNRAFVCFGPWTTGAITDCEVQIGNAESSTRFGYAVAVIGDENADGATDVMVSAPDSDVGGADAGAVYEFRGPFSAGSLSSANASARLYGSTPGGNVGWELDRAGDYNGDGLDDLLVGAYTGSTAWVVFGGGR